MATVAPLGDNVIDDDDTLRLSIVLLRLLPPGGVPEHARRSLRRQLILDEAQLLVLLELILEFLKLEILLREFLRAAECRHVGVSWPRLRSALLRAEVLSKLLGRAHLYSEAPAALAT